MTNVLKTAAIAAAFALAACGADADDQAAANIEEMTENRADALDEQAETTANGQAEDALEDQADATREMGEDAAERADDNDDARVENEVVNAM